MVEFNKVISLLLHIKLGLIRSFIWVLDHDSDALKYLRPFSPGVSAAKIDSGKTNL